MADLKISDAKHIEQITGNERIPVSANGEAGYVEAKQLMVDTKNFLTSNQAAQKYYPKTDGENLKQQIGDLSFRAISKDEFGKLETKKPNTLYIVTK